jgi:hypothetical protein
LGPIQSAFVRTATGTLQLGGRRWRWIWEKKKGRAKIGRTIARILGSSFACFAAYRIGSTWPLAGGAIICAVLARGYAKADQSEQPQTEPEDQGEPEIELTPEEIVLQLVVDLIGDAPGIHLDTLLTQLQQVPDWAAMTRDELRLVLHAAGCPIRRALRVGQRTGIAGVHRDDAQAALDALAEDPTPLPPPGLDTDL